MFHSTLTHYSLYTLITFNFYIHTHPKYTTFILIYHLFTTYLPLIYHTYLPLIYHLFTTYLPLIYHLYIKKIFFFLFFFLFFLFLFSFSFFSPHYLLYTLFKFNFLYIYTPKNYPNIHKKIINRLNIKILTFISIFTHPLYIFLYTKIETHIYILLYIIIY